MIPNERLDEMIKTAKLFADISCGLELNGLKAKDIYAAFVELKELREIAKTNVFQLRSVSEEQIKSIANLINQSPSQLRVLQEE
ncbi:hypothetical protein [Anaerosinus massiliensis]|uniref:hypothetical protein n=1 Tax=Massilibacillus massiliensis TaxID=1806837 RepID=UPI000DA63050|nr:hypothetical protein [Massilibacillus massiliensis]